MIVPSHSCHSSSGSCLGLPLLRQHRQPAAQKITTLALRLLRTHSFNRISRRPKELGCHLLVPGVVGMLAIRSVLDGIEVGEVVHKGHRAVARRLAGCVLLDGRVQIDDTVCCSLGPARSVQGQQVGEDDMHLGVLCTHLANEGVIGLDNVAGGLLANEDIVGTEQHQDDIRGVLIQPDSEVALRNVVYCL